MDLKILNDTPPWDWPEDAGEIFLKFLQDRRTDPSDRLIAAELAGDFTVINDELVAGLLTVLGNENESRELRGKAAISLGPVLEEADTDGFDDPDELPITESTFHKIQETLRKLYMDAGVPKEVRRRILEASVRAPQDWHRDAVRAAYFSNDEDWKLTAVFCMRYVRGFDDEIVASLDSTSPDIHYEAVSAAGNWKVLAAWPHIAALVSSAEIEKALLLAAIDAAASIRPNEAADILDDLTDSDDEDIVEAAYEAISMAELDWGEDEDAKDDSSR